MIRRESTSSGGLMVLIWAALFVAGLALLLIGITHEGLWLDEAYSAAMASHPFAEIWRLAGQSDNHPPLYYFLLRIFVLAWGDSVFVLRLPSVVGALALAALGAGPIRRACGPRTGIIFSFMALITPVVSHMAQEARMYMWAAFFVTGCASYGHLAATGDKKGDWIGFCAFAVAAAYTHHYALLAVALIYAMLFVRFLFDRKMKLKSYSLTAAVVVVCYLPWGYNLLRRAVAVTRGFWIPELTWGAMKHILMYPFDYRFGRPEIPLTSRLALYLMVSLIIFGLVMAILKQPAGSRLVLLAACVFTLTLLTGIVASYVIRPVLIPRYMYVVLGLFLLPAAYGLSLLGSRWVILATCVLLFALSFPQIVHIHQKEYNGPMPEVLAYLKGNANSDDVFLHVNMHSLGPLSYHLRSHLHFLYRPDFRANGKDSLFSDNVISGPDVSAFLEEHRDSNVWLVGCAHSEECRTADFWLESGELKSINGSKEFQNPFSWLEVKLWRIEQQTPLTPPE